MRQFKVLPATKSALPALLTFALIGLFSQAPLLAAAQRYSPDADHAHESDPREKNDKSKPFDAVAKHAGADADHVFFNDCRASFARYGISADVYMHMAVAYELHRHRLGQKQYVILIDYSRSSGEKRFFLINPQTCRFYNTYVAHARGFAVERVVSGSRKQVYMGDPDNDGMLDRCSHEGKKARMSPYGLMIAKGRFSRQYYLNETIRRNFFRRFWQLPFYLLAKLAEFNDSIGTQKMPDGETYDIDGIRLHGLERHNRDLYDRGYLMVQTDNAHRKFIRMYGQLFRTNGHIGLPPGELQNLEERVRISDGTLVYVHAPQCANGHP